MNPEHQPSQPNHRSVVADLVRVIERSDPRLWSKSITTRYAARGSNRESWKDSPPESFEVTCWEIPRGLDDTLLIELYRKQESSDPELAQRKKNVQDLYEEIFNANLFDVVLGDRIDMFAVKTDSESIQGDPARDVYRAAKKRLQSVEEVARKFLIGLQHEPERARELDWRYTFSEDEKETVFRTEKDGFDIEVREFVSLEMLDHRVRRLTATVALQNGLISPVLVDGEVLKPLILELKSICQTSQPSDAN